MIIYCIYIGNISSTNDPFKLFIPHGNSLCAGRIRKFIQRLLSLQVNLPATLCLSYSVGWAENTERMNVK